MTIPVWLLIPLIVCAALGVAAVLLFLAVLVALGASHRRDQVTPLLADVDESGLLIEGPWQTVQDAEGGR